MKINLRITLAVLIISAVVISCQPAAEPPYDGAAELALVDTWMSEFEAKNMDGALSTMAGGTYMYGPGVNDSTTVEDWASSWKEAYGSGDTEFTYTRAANRFINITEEENAGLAGYWVMEWLPQMVIRVMSATRELVLFAS